jgi:hypothetical protein
MFIALPEIQMVMRRSVSGALATDPTTQRRTRRDSRA